MPKRSRDFNVDSLQTGTIRWGPELLFITSAGTFSSKDPDRRPPFVPSVSKTKRGIVVVDKRRAR